MIYGSKKGFRQDQGINIPAIKMNPSLLSQNRGGFYLNELPLLTVPKGDIWQSMVFNCDYLPPKQDNLGDLLLWSGAHFSSID